MPLDVKRRKNRTWIVAGAVLAAVLFAAAVFLNVFAVREVTV